MWQSRSIISLNMKYNKNNIIDEFDNISNIISKWLQKWKTPLKFQKTDNTNRLIDSLGSDFRKTQENFYSSILVDIRIINWPSKKKSKTI